MVTCNHIALERRSSLMITEEHSPGADTPGKLLVSEQNPAAIRLRELNDMLNGLGSSMLNVALEQGQILTDERSKYPARAKKGEYGWTDFLVDAGTDPEFARRRMALWADREKLNLPGSDKLTLTEAERIIGARKPKTEPAAPAPKKSEPKTHDVEATVTVVEDEPKSTSVAADVKQIVAMMHKWKIGDKVVAKALDELEAKIKFFRAVSGIKATEPEPSQQEPAPTPTPAPAQEAAPRPIEKPTVSPVTPQPVKAAIALESVSTYFSNITCPKCNNRVEVCELRNKNTGRKVIRVACECTMKGAPNGITQSRIPGSDQEWLEVLKANGWAPRQEAR